MKILEILARVFLGGGFLVFGINYFFPFMPVPTPPDMSDAAKAWIGGLAGAPSYLAIVKWVEVIGGATVLTGIALPFGLLILAPLVINIVYFNTYLLGAPSVDVALLVAGIFLAWRKWAVFKPLFR